MNEWMAGWMDPFIKVKSKRNHGWIFMNDKHDLTNISMKMLRSHRLRFLNWSCWCLKHDSGYYWTSQAVNRWTGEQEAFCVHTWRSSSIRQVLICEQITDITKVKNTGNKQLLFSIIIDLSRKVITLDNVMRHTLRLITKYVLQFRITALI